MCRCRNQAPAATRSSGVDSRQPSPGGGPEGAAVEAPDAAADPRLKEGGAEVGAVEAGNGVVTA